MPFNCPQHRDLLHEVPEYLGSPSFGPNYAWASGPRGDVLTDVERQTPVPLIVVGRIDHQSFWGGTVGDFRIAYDIAMEDARYRFWLKRPSEAAFVPDFDLGVTRLKGFTSYQMGMRPDKQATCDTPHGVRICFSKPLFEVRDAPVAARHAYEMEEDGKVIYTSQPVTTTPSPGSHSSDDLAPKEMVDDTTYFWPVSDQFQDEFSKTSTTHKVVPLPVVYNGREVEVHKVPDVLKGALVEVEFQLVHENRSADVRQHSYNAEITLIKVLKLPKVAKMSTGKGRARDIRIGMKRELGGRHQEGSSKRQKTEAGWLSSSTLSSGSE